MCDNWLASKQMKRLFPTSLAFLLVMGSLGHVFAAAFCPRMLGHDCCAPKTSSSQHPSQSPQHMHGMAMDGNAMDGMANESMSMVGSDMEGMMMDDADIPPSSFTIDDKTLLSTSDELVPANKLVLPNDGCTHCMSHSGIQNAPVSSLSAPDQSNKDIGSARLPVSRLLAPTAMRLARIGLPKEHAPPGSRAPLHILISVFLI